MRFRLLEPWRTRVLWLSLGLNVFAAALIVTPHVWHGMHGGHGGPPGPPSFEMLVQRIARELDPADAARFRAAMAKEQPWYEMGRQRLADAKDDVAAAFGRTPYDPQAANAALGAMQDRLRESGQRFDDSLATAVGGLSPEGRTRLAASMKLHRP